MPSLQTLISLPQNDGSWYITFSLIPAWFQDEKNSEEFIRPWMIFIVDLESGAIINLTLMDTQPDLPQVYDFLTKSMVSPARNSVSAQRPKEIHFDDQILAKDLETKLLALAIKTIYNPQKEAAEEIMINLLPFVTDDQIPLSGLMEQHGVKTDLVKSLFHNANHLWNIKPWERLNNEDIISVWVGKQKKPYFISLMGSGGMEFGFAVFKTQNDLESFFVELATRMTKIPAKGRHVFLYNQPPMISFDDIDFVKKLNLPIPSMKHFPTPMLFKPDDVYRPSAPMLRWYEAVLLALPKLMDDINPENKKLEQEYEVLTSNGPTVVKFIYPAFSQQKINFWKNDGALKMMAEMIIKSNQL